jgi:hypothetical protein
MRGLLAILLVALCPASGPGDALEPWGSNHHPSDVAKKHVQEVAAAKFSYTVTQGGTMDGTNCRSPLSVGMSNGPGADQTWESNRAVRLENIGDTDVVNPWLSNGRNTFRTMEEIVAAATTPGMTDKEKAYAIWFQEIQHRYHFGAGSGEESGNPVKVFNVYGYNTCGDDSMCISGFWRKAGLKVAPARLVGHCVAQAYFDHRWNLMDGDQHCVYLLRDNETIAGEQDIVRDHDLVKRSHTQGILEPDVRSSDEWQSSIYVFEGEVKGDRNCYVSSMNMALRPGEAITWRWGHLQPIKYRGQHPAKHPETIANGLWEYRPDFTKDLWRKGAESAEGVRTEGGALAAEPDKSGSVVWIVRSPYVFVGGKLEVDGTAAKFAVSFDGKKWEDVESSLDKMLSPDAPARYEYRLRCQLEGSARLKSLRIVNDVQMAPLALPGMMIGKNEFVYSDESKGARKVRITHEWVERSASKPPESPASPEYPADGGEAKGTAIVFKWAPAKDPDGDKIVDYHFELSSRPDMRWPLSTNFYRMISRTPDRGKAQYTLPQVGLLNPDRTYYWHVRAKDEKGVWGAWSKTWKFTPRGPSLPTDLAIDFDETKATGILRWKPGATGKKPAKYRVYGSDEKGFSVNDESYPRSVGASKEVPATAPANFVAEVTGTELAVIGREATFPNANSAYYRVVAVDDQGSRSGASDYTVAPRPFISSKPAAKAKVGSEYRYPATAIRSLGDLRMRNVSGQDSTSFFDVEHPKFAIQKGPAWLKIDERTGLLTGVPASPGKVEVAISATIELEDRRLSEQDLSWGREKVVSSGIKTLGSATQEYVIDVEP